jgi:hypothetical protein
MASQPGETAGFSLAVRQIADSLMPSSHIIQKSVILKYQWPSTTGVKSKLETTRNATWPILQHHPYQQQPSTPSTSSLIRSNNKINTL